jgi:hypothetical protein
MNPVRVLPALAVTRKVIEPGPRPLLASNVIQLSRVAAVQSHSGDVPTAIEVPGPAADGSDWVGGVREKPHCAAVLPACVTVQV